MLFGPEDELSPGVGVGTSWVKDTCSRLSGMTRLGFDTLLDSCTMAIRLDEGSLDAAEDSCRGADLERCEETARPSLALTIELERASPV